MKKISTFLIAFLFCMMTSNSYSQTWGSTSTPTYSSGNVGIGFTSMSSAPTNARLRIDNDGSLYPPGPGVTSPVPEILINRSFMPTITGTIPNIFEVWYHALYPAGTAPSLVDVIDPQGNLMINGFVAIGPGATSLPTPSGYSLYVAQGILAEKVKVAVSTTTDWSDFVFNNNYKLMPLSDVEKYILFNHHLPEVPSATDVVNNGIDVAKMDAKLLQKVEELTLYVIQQQKQIEAAQKEIAELKKSQQ